MACLLAVCKHERNSNREEIQDFLLSCITERKVAPKKGEERRRSGRDFGRKGKVEGGGGEGEGGLFSSLSTSLFFFSFFAISFSLLSLFFADGMGKEEKRHEWRIKKREGRKESLLLRLLQEGIPVGWIIMKVFRRILQTYDVSTSSCTRILGTEILFLALMAP